MSLLVLEQGSSGLLTMVPRISRKEIYFLTDLQAAGWAPKIRPGQLE